jgi:hypothetical protein
MNEEIRKLWGELRDVVHREELEHHPDTLMILAQIALVSSEEARRARRYARRIWWGAHRSRYAAKIESCAVRWADAAARQALERARGDRAEARLRLAAIEPNAEHVEWLAVALELAPDLEQRRLFARRFREQIEQWTERYES